MMWIFAIDFGVYNTSIEITVRRNKGEHYTIAPFRFGFAYFWTTYL
jgi:hypothetical protein